MTGWSWGARVLRSQTLSLREKDFVSAAEVSGESHVPDHPRRDLPEHDLAGRGQHVRDDDLRDRRAGGAPVPRSRQSERVSWGTNLYWAQNNGALLTGAWWTVVPSGVAIALVAFAFALINYAVDEVTNPRLRAQRLASEALRKSGRSIARRARDPGGAPCRLISRTSNLRRSKRAPAWTIRGADAESPQSVRRVPGHRGRVRAVDKVSFELRRARSSGWPVNPAAANRPSPWPSCACCKPRDHHQAAMSASRAAISSRCPIELAAISLVQISMVFQSAMNALNPVMTVGDQIDRRDPAPTIPTVPRRRPANGPRNCSTSSASIRVGSTPTRTSSPAACANAR